MKKLFLSFASFLARILPLPLKQALYRMPALAGLIRGSINASVDEGLTVITVAAGDLKGYRVLLNLKTEKSRWLGTYEHVFGARLREPEFAYFLESGVLSYDSDIFAFPRAAQDLRSGQYFVPINVSDGALFSLCQQLRLRSVQCFDG